MSVLTAPASDLRRLNGTLRLFHEDMVALEKAAAEHEQSDTDRFGAVAKGNAALAADVAFIKDYLNVLHDQMIEGFRQLGARLEKVEPKKRGSNGR